MIDVKIQRLQNSEGIDLPAYATPGSAGMDLRAADRHTLQPKQRCLVSTGIAIALPDGYEAQVRPRSGLAAKYGITVLNAPGTIDSDYRGEIKVPLINHGTEVFDINKGDRIAQLVIAPVVHANLVETKSLDETARGRGGFGSSGRA